MNRVREEWAKQLLYMLKGEGIDYDKLRVMYVEPGCYVHVIYDYEEGDLSEYGDVSRYVKAITRVVELNKFYDNVNQEVTRLGYEENTNTLLVGETREFFTLGGYIEDKRSHW